MILRLIANGEMTGYGLIKDIGAITGKRPSSGSVYPLLKSMETTGWITSAARGNKIFYTIGPDGEAKLREIQGIKKEFMTKIMGTISMANEVFDQDEVEENMNLMGMVGPILAQIVMLKRKGVGDEAIREVLTRTVEEIRMLGEGMEEKPDGKQEDKTGTAGCEQ